jgi:hypothetical protein
MLAHAVSQVDLENAPEGVEPPQSPISHFAGSIYEMMNQDAVANLARCLALCQKPVRFACYTPNTLGFFSRSGMMNEHVRVLFAPKDEVMQAPRSSSIVFLPLAFHSPNHLEICVSVWLS